MTAPASLLSHLPPIAYAGRVACVAGYGAAARHQIHVLRKYGLRLKIVDAGSSGDPDASGESAFVRACKASDPGADRPRASIIHLGPNCTAEWRRRLPRPHVLVSVWETTRLPRAWVDIANSFDQVWCATEWQAEVYRASGVTSDRVRFVPFALDPALYQSDGPVLPELADLKAQGYALFGSMFQWTERKDPRALIGSFLAAFQSGERVALVLKAYEGDDPANSVAGHVESITQSYQLNGPAPLVKVITNRLTHAEVLSFYRGLDCYVSAHRGEGFGLPIAEALLLGRQVIATDWSAPAEYAAGCYLPAAYSLEAPHSMGWQPFYSIDQEWASPDKGSLSAWMREVYSGTARAELDAGQVAAKLGALPLRAAECARAALDELLR